MTTDRTINQGSTNTSEGYNTLRNRLRNELMEEIMADPCNVLLGIPLPELSRIIHEHKEREHTAFQRMLDRRELEDYRKRFATQVSPYDLAGMRRASVRKP